MTDYISPLNDKFLSFGRAAKLAALERPDLKKKHVLETFKHALFAGEFEHHISDIDWTGIGADPNWLYILYQQPKAEIAIDSMVPKALPHKFYSMDRSSITSVLLSEGGLPEPLEDWDLYFDFLSPAYGKETMYRHLSNIPLSSFPRKGRKALAEIHISRPKLVLWMKEKDFSLPRFLTRQNGRPSSATMVPPKLIGDNDNSVPCGKGRPGKAGWSFIRQTVREIADSDPSKLYKTIAHEAHLKARQTFADHELPSENTILRNMAKILRG